MHNCNLLNDKCVQFTAGAGALNVKGQQVPTEVKYNLLLISQIRSLDKIFMCKFHVCILKLGEVGHGSPCLYVTFRV